MQLREIKPLAPTGGGGVGGAGVRVARQGRRERRGMRATEGVGRVLPTGAPNPPRRRAEPRRGHRFSCRSVLARLALAPFLPPGGPRRRAYARWPAAGDPRAAASDSQAGSLRAPARSRSGRPPASAPRAWPAAARHASASATDRPPPLQPARLSPPPPPEPTALHLRAGPVYVSGMQGLAHGGVGDAMGGYSGGKASITCLNTRGGGGGGGGGGGVPGSHLRGDTALFPSTPPLCLVIYWQVQASE